MTIQPDRVRARRLAVQHEFSAPLLGPAGGKVLGDTLGELVGERRITRCLATNFITQSKAS